MTDTQQFHGFKGHLGPTYWECDGGRSQPHNQQQGTVQATMIMIYIFALRIRLTY